MVKKIVPVMVLAAGLAGMWADALSQRRGTTAANFLEIGIGAAQTAMGDASVGATSDLMSIYWNPAGLAFMQKSETQFMYQPWLVDINSSFAGAGLVLPGIGTLSVGLFYVGYGEMDVTTLEAQNGTGEKFSASDYAVSLAYARKIVQWFSFGAAAKMVNSQIWHTNAKAMAVDLGVIVHTPFFSPTKKQEDGMKIGMSISNYGSQMKYDGLDLLNPIDIEPDAEGNYKDVPGQFRLTEWELPLLLRVGIAVYPIVAHNQRLTVAVDALHPNNNSESVNVGAQYELTRPGFGTFYLRGGYKALFLEKSEFGPTYGAGFLLRMGPSLGLKVDFAYRSLGVLGSPTCFNLGVMF
jgi:hypothetical protein